MQNRKWPGNIRELENFVERLVTVVSPEATFIDNKNLAREYKKEYQQISSYHEESIIHKSLKETLDECEEKLIKKALINSNWNQSKAAHSLQISKSNIRYRMERLNIQDPNK